MDDSIQRHLYSHIDRLLAATPAYTDSKAILRILTLGGFRVWRQGIEISDTDWGREKAVHLFQFFVTSPRQYLHKEQIIDRLWPALEANKGDRDFKVALNSVSNTLEPDRKPWSESVFIRRQGLAYGLDTEQVWLDSHVFELLIASGNHALMIAKDVGSAEGYVAEEAIAHFEAATTLYQGDYLPERRYEDWTSAMRERLQVLALGAMTTLAELLVGRAPLESIRLAQRVLSIDTVWEDAYRIQMRAYAGLGNRPMALRVYQQCVDILRREFDVEPLPETVDLYERIRSGEVFRNA